MSSRFLGSVSDAQDSYLSMCERNGNELLNIVDNMLDIGLIEQRGSSAMHMREYPVTNVVDASVEQVELLAKDKQITTAIRLARTDAVIFADRDKVLRVLVNLLANAIKFTDACGHVVLRTQRVDENGVPMIQFSVQDDGRGIANPGEVFRDGGVITRESTTRQSTGAGVGVLPAGSGDAWRTHLGGK